MEFDQIHQKLWVLAPTLSKTVGAKAPTAPILTGALRRKRLLTCIDVIIRLFVDISTIIKPTKPIKFKSRNLCSENE